MKKLSVVLSTINEGKNIGPCLESVAAITDEIIVFDESSSDKTREIAQQHGAKVFKVKHEPLFHITKQKALEKASGDWILQLDADERVTPELAKEIKETIEKSDTEIKKRRISDQKKWKLFMRHQEIIEKRDGKIGKKDGGIVAFFIPRINFFLGRPLIHAGVYPDGVIRLVKKGKARFPCKSVHEQIEVDGEVSWLFNNLEHHDSPTLSRYVKRLNRYTDLHADDLAKAGVGKSLRELLIYTFIKPVVIFVSLYFRHRGYLDGVPGFVWSVFSAWHYPIAFFKYYTNKEV